MSEGMIREDVPAVLDLKCNVRPLANIAANHKKRGMNVVLRENFEEIEGVRIVRPIVKGERNLLRSRREMRECATEPLAGGRHGLVSSSNRGRTGSQHGKEHG